MKTIAPPVPVATLLVKSQFEISTLSQAQTAPASAAPFESNTTSLITAEEPPLLS